MPLLEGSTPDVIATNIAELIRAEDEIPAHVAQALRMRRPASRDHRGRLLRGHTMRGRVPKPQYPTRIEEAYASAIIDVLAGVKELARGLLDALPRHDALDVVRRLGLDIVIENPAGSVRHWTDSDGSTGETVMKWPYGYIDGFKGSDGEDVDAYLGPEEVPDWIYVVEQMKKSSGFTEYDEQKVMLGWPTADSATSAYLEQYNDPRFFGGLSVLSREDFIAKLTAIGSEGGKITHERMDESAAVIHMRQQIERARRTLADPSRVRRLQNTAQRYAQATSERQRGELQRQAKSALGVDVAMLDRQTNQLFDKFIAENVALIESLGNSALDDVANIIARAYSSDAPINVAKAQAAKEIEDRFGVSTRRARFIARDQIGKLNGKLTRSRQQEMGLTRFRWRSREDSRVRPLHAYLNGQVFSWDDLPHDEYGPIHPGSPFGCRCGAEPMFDEVKEIPSYGYVGAPMVNYTR